MNVLPRIPAPPEGANPLSATAPGPAPHHTLRARFAHVWAAPEPEPDPSSPRPKPAPTVPALATSAAPTEVDALVTWLQRSGLALPATLFAELQRPLFFVYGQFLRAAAPILPPAGRLSALLEDPARMDALLRRLSAPGDGP